MLIAARTLARQFWRNCRGAVTVEFVVSLPVLVAVLAFSTQYGRMMQARSALDVAVRDAARLISRAPLAEDGSGVPPIFLTHAQNMISNRVGCIAEEITFVTVTGTAVLTTVEVEAKIEFPFLNAFSFGENDLDDVTLRAAEVWPR